MEKAVINTDMINDNDNIYLSANNGFEFYKYPITRDLFLSLNAVMEEHNKSHPRPDSVFIPFVAYNNFEKVADTQLSLSFHNYMDSMRGTSFHYMIPDCVKDLVKPTK